MGDKELIEKIKGLTFNFKPTASEKKRSGFREVTTAEEVYEEATTPDGYMTKDAKGRQLIIVHGDEDRRQVAEIIAEKQGV